MLGQAGRVGPRGVTAISGLLACVLISAVGVAALRSDTAGADTVLQRGPDATLELADGTRRAAVEGERVPRGATVLAGAAGAVLQTRDREVHLGGQTGVTVVDGLRQVLRSGFVLVDGSDAPGVQMETPAGTVTTADDSLVRIDGGALVRAGVLRGDAASVRAAGRRASADVPTYYQVQVPTGGLPGAASPFVLTADAYERALAADLVRADDDLNALASRLDADGSAGRVVLTALRAELAGEPAVTPALASASATASGSGGDRALAFLVATAADDADPLARRYDRVRDLRAAGGSWGIVAAIVSAEVGRVASALSALVDSEVVPVLASEPFDVGSVLNPDGSVAGPGAPAGADFGGGTDEPPSGGDDDGNGGSDPQPSPSPSPSPADPVTDVVDTVVDTVLDLVSPSPSPSPSPTSSPTSSSEPLPLPLPLPVPTLGVPLLK